MLATSESTSCTGYFYCCNYSIGMLRHHTKVTAYNEICVPRISFSQETNTQPITCSFTVAVEEPENSYLYDWRVKLNHEALVLG